MQLESPTTPATNPAPLALEALIEPPNPVHVALQALVDVARDPRHSGGERVQAAALLLSNRELIAIEELDRRAEAREAAEGEWDPLWLEALERAGQDQYHVYGVTACENEDDRRISGPWDPEDDAVEAQTLEYAAIAIDWDDASSPAYMKALKKYRNARLVFSAPFDICVLGDPDVESETDEEE